MANTLQNFKDGFRGVRPNRFLIETSTWPTGVSPTPTSQTTYLYVKGADIPGSNIATINVAWQGRIVKFSGDRTYTDWVINIYDSSVQSSDLRRAFESWIEAMDGRNTHQINYRLNADWVVSYDDLTNGTQSSPNVQGSGSFKKRIKLKNCFPTDISAITLNYDSGDSFAEFQVQMAYDYWEYA